MDGASSIGRGTLVRGSVRGEGDLEILGRVEGSVAVSGALEIGEGALVKSDVSGRRVTVRGAVAGNVSATEAILLEPGARVVGDLGAPQVGIRAGALVRGHVSTSGPLAEGAPARTPAAASRGRQPAPAARPAPAPAAARAPAARAAAAPAARPAPAPAARPAPAPSRPVRAESPTLTSARVDLPARVEPPVAAPMEDVEDAAEQRSEEESAAEAESGGPPPPVVPTIRKGAKASLRRKGAR
jgi:cytoskeletal protein CcmA (bactofilin family)